MPPPECADTDARLVADTLVQADLWGHQSHGVLRLPWYLTRLKAGVCTAVAAPKTAGRCRRRGGDRRRRRDEPGADRLRHEGCDPPRQGARHRRGRAAQLNHFGTGALLHAAGGARRLRGVPVDQCPALRWRRGAGGRRPVGTNPWSWAKPPPPPPWRPPASFAPLVLDIANTGVARGKIYLAKQKGETIPPG